MAKAMAKSHGEGDGEGDCGARAGAGVRGRVGGASGRCGRVRAVWTGAGGCGRPVRARGAGVCVRRGTRAGVWAIQRVRAARAGHADGAGFPGRASPAEPLDHWPLATHKSPVRGSRGRRVCALRWSSPYRDGGAGGQRGSVALSPTQKATLVTFRFFRL